MTYSQNELHKKSSRIMVLISTWYTIGLQTTGHFEEEPDKTLEGLWGQLLPLIKKEFGESS